MSLDGHDEASLESSTALQTPPTPSLGAIKEPIYDATELEADNGDGDGDRSCPAVTRSAAKDHASAFQGVAPGATLDKAAREPGVGLTTGARRNLPGSERRVPSSPRADLRGLAPLPYVPAATADFGSGRVGMMSGSQQSYDEYARGSRSEAYPGYGAGTPPPPTMPPTDPLPVPTPYRTFASTAPLVPRPAVPPVAIGQTQQPIPASASTTALSSSPIDAGGALQPPRIPSRKLLQSALDLAQRAVELDKANDVPGALTMYRDAVVRLRSVMERVGMDLGPLPHGLGLPEQTEQDREEIAQARRRRKSTNGRSEEEGKTLKGIHDAYIARIALLANMDPSPRERHPSERATNPRSDDVARSGDRTGRIPLPAVVNGVAVSHPSSTLLQGPPIVRQRQTSLSATTGPAFGPASAPGQDMSRNPRHNRQNSATSTAQFSTRSGASGSSGTGTQVDDRDKNVERGQFSTMPRSTSRGTRLGQSILAGTAGSYRNPAEDDVFRPQISPRNASLQFGSQQLLPAAEAGLSDQPNSARIAQVPSERADLVIPVEAVVTVKFSDRYAELSPLRTGQGMAFAFPSAGHQNDPQSAQSTAPSANVSEERSLVENGVQSRIPAIIQSQPSPVSPYNQPPPVPGKSSQLSSPQPEAPPVNAVRLPFYLLRLIHLAIISPSGGFISPRLHLPHALWTQNSTKLPFLDIKIRMLEFLAQQVATVGRMGDAVAVRTDGPEEGLRDAAVAYMRGLEELNGLMEEIMDKFGKKLGLTASTVKTGRKSSGTFTAFGSRLSKSLDRMTNSKSPETSTAYFEALARFAGESQALDRCLSPGFVDNLSSDLRIPIEGRIQLISSFLTSCVLAFVLPDINALLARYLKLSSRYLED